MITRKSGLCFACVLLTAFAFVLQAAAQAPPMPEYPPIPEYLVQDQFTSPSLEGNLIGDPATRDVLVYLPPSYDTSPDRITPPSTCLVAMEPTTERTLVTSTPLCKPLQGRIWA